jgi:hypothetical protein
MTSQQADFSSPETGTDLNIIMTDSEFNGHVYKTISAITAKGKSLLSQDPLISRTWLEDDTTWRDVFLPKKAPNVTPYEFLEMIADGTNPYWDDTDQTNKKWVFPNRPDLEELANNRQRNLDADEDEEFEQASDLDTEYVTLNNMTSAKVGTYSDDVMDVGATVLAETAPKVVHEAAGTQAQPTEPEATDDNYDDLPF